MSYPLEVRPTLLLVHRADALNSGSFLNGVRAKILQCLRFWEPGQRPGPWDLDRLMSEMFSVVYVQLPEKAGDLIRQVLEVSNHKHTS